MLSNILKEITCNKVGVEIGGPSPSAVIIYENASNIDNVIFSNNTIWSNHTEDYNYYNNKKGKVIINDAVNISLVHNEYYDFCFSSHSLEHIANPLKAINEWLRILKKNGYIIIIVPEKSACFDHKRKYSTFSTLLSQYEKNVGEDDLSTLPEILKNHDLNMDPPAGDLDAFTKRSLDNFNNRCLHHYVYNDELLMEICNYFKCEFIYKETIGLNRWFIMKKSSVQHNMTFVEIANKYGAIDTDKGTDKNTTHSYGPVYESIFYPIKNTTKSILEIGLASGKSLQLYSEYFTNAMIYGIDIHDNCLEDVKTIERVNMVFGDAKLPSIINHFNRQYDVIIEDASHEFDDQVCHFKDFCEFVLLNGYYIIEDVHENNMNKLKAALEPLANSKGFVLEILDLRNIKNRFDDILFIFKRVHV